MITAESEYHIKHGRIYSFTKAQTCDLNHNSRYKFSWVSTQHLCKLFQPKRPTNHEYKWLILRKMCLTLASSLRTLLKKGHHPVLTSPISSSKNQELLYEMSLKHSRRMNFTTESLFSALFLFSWQNGYLTQPRRLAAGFCAGITEALVIVTPFEVVKIRLQQQKGMVQSQLKYHVRHKIP